MRLAAILVLLGLLSLTACGGGSTGGGTPPAPTPTPNAADDCPASGTLPSSIARGSATKTIRRVFSTAKIPRYVPGEIAVTYAGSASPALSGKRIADLDYRTIGVHTRVLSLNPASVDAELTKLQAMPGVRGAGRVTYAQRMSFSDDDPYYAGFTGTAAPYYETSTIPGQWDMHAINLDGAWSQFSSVPIIGAPIAIVDTGVDVTHPELTTPSGVTAPKITRTQCYVTYPAGTAQTTGQYVTDTDGHGTNVAGISDGDADNSFAFASAAFDAPLLAYRIFPTDPPGGCDVDNAPPQCFTTSADEASAIDDAVQHGAKVINLSLGGPGPCSTSDPEYTAVEQAIAAGVVVVAAAGNGTGDPPIGQPALDCPAADPGVIAVGASALNDGNTFSGPFEYVASYSNYVSGTGQSNSGAYLVAPGGDPPASEQCGSCTVDNLHWIENIYSTDGVGITSGSACAGGTDYAGENNDCNVLIVGTSQATPHVTGVVSLMLAKNPNLTPAQIATGLCASADDIGDTKEGCGRLDAAAAVTWAASH